MDFIVCLFVRVLKGICQLLVVTGECSVSSQAPISVVLVSMNQDYFNYSKKVNF